MMLISSTIIDAVAFRISRERIRRVIFHLSMWEIVVLLLIFLIVYPLTYSCGLGFMIAFIILEAQFVCIFAPLAYFASFYEPRIETLKYSFRPTADQNRKIKLCCLLLLMIVFIPPIPYLAGSQLGVYLLLFMMALVPILGAGLKSYESETFANSKHYKLLVLSVDVPSFYFALVFTLIFVKPLMGFAFFLVVVLHLLLVGLKENKRKEIVDTIWLEFLAKTQVSKGFVDAEDIINFANVDRLSFEDLRDLETYFTCWPKSIFTLQLDFELEFEALIDGEWARFDTTLAKPFLRRPDGTINIPEKIKILKFRVRIPDRYIICDEYG